MRLHSKETDDPIRIKDRICVALNEVLSGDGLSVARVRVLGTHSVRKFALTIARGIGCSKVRFVCYFVTILIHTCAEIICFICRTTQSIVDAGRTPRGSRRHTRIQSAFCGC